MADQILVSDLELLTRIGITAEERAEPQRLTVSLAMEPLCGTVGLRDRIESTVDYFTATRAVQALAAEGERALIETLAEDIAAHLLASHPLAAVEVELRKYVLTDAAFVAVKIRRSAANR